MTPDATHRMLMALLLKVANAETLTQGDREYAGEVRRELAKLEVTKAAGENTFFTRSTACPWCLQEMLVVQCATGLHRVLPFTVGWRGAR